MNQIAVANLMMNLKMNKSKTVDESMVRHMILNSIRMYRTEHRNEYGEVVLTWDSKHSWRRDYFPEYKASRRKGREESNLDWDDIFTTLNKIRKEIKENFPYKYLEVFGAEADDIIGSLCEENRDEKIMIISGDKDFIQLQKYSNVTQWSPITKKQVNGFDPTIYLKLPKGMDEFFEKESEDHYPVGGAIQFMQGDKQDLRSDTLTFRPEVGKLLMFPSWLKHSVYPFDVDGERRSMSFNAYYVDKK